MCKGTRFVPKNLDLLKGWMRIEYEIEGEDGEARLENYLRDHPPPDDRCPVCNPALLP